MLPERIAFVDIETTGSRSQYDRIIEIGIIRVESNIAVKKYQTLINPHAYLPQEIEKLTGITSSDLENAPSFREVKDEIMEMLSDCCFVAHNVRFDYGFLKSEFKRHGADFSAKHFCTVKLSRALFPRHRHHNLDSIIERFQIPCPQRHRAFDDAHVLFEFYTKIQDMFPLEKIKKAVDLGLRRPTIPLSLSLSDLESLPELPGVYIFYGGDGAPLYIGKSIDIKSRVLSHFSGDVHSGLEMKISQQIKNIETITTAGELSALFLEADLIKKKMPLYNRKLRIKRQLTAIKSRINNDGFITTSLSTLSDSEIGALHTTIDVASEMTDNFLAATTKKEDIVGFFKSARQAKDFLYDAAKNHGLCEKLLGLEKTTGSCFGYRLGRCKGACVNEEKQIFYNLRFAGVFNASKIDAWPFPSPIMIKEVDEMNGKSEYLIIDKWCYLGSISLDDDGNINPLTREYVFDLDMYKILKGYLRSPKNLKRVTLLTEEKIQTFFRHIV